MLLTRAMARNQQGIERKDTSKKTTIPAPILGLNYRDPIAAMKPLYALQLDNLICRTGYLEVRKGRSDFTTNFPAPVETLMSYIDTSGVKKVFAAAGTGIYDASSVGPVGAAVVAGLTNAYWNWTQFSNTGGNYLICCNGVDNAKYYNGAAWADSGFTGLALTSFAHLQVWKRRIWVVQKNSMSAWYGATDAIAGALTQFDFSGIFRRGGYVIATLAWTIDGGSGVDDLFVVVTNQGEIAVYQGTDPTSSTTFSLVGVYYLGPPVGKRFYAQLGGDLIILTNQGLIPLSKYLQTASIDRSQIILTDRIQQRIADDISAYGSVQGWEIHVFFDDNLLFIQVPAGVAGVGRYQYVMNLITGGWSRFLVNVAITWLVQDSTLYMGDSAKTYNAWTGGLDGTNIIPYLCLPAFSYFGSPTQLKKFNLGQILFESDQAPVYAWKLQTDFSQDYYFSPLNTAPAGTGNLWDVAIWDGAVWGTLTTFSKGWFALAGMGYSASMVFYGVSAGQKTRILTLAYTYEVGGLL